MHYAVKWIVKLLYIYVCFYVVACKADQKISKISVNQINFYSFFISILYYPIHFAISRKKLSHYFLTLSCLDGLDESLSRAGKGAPRPKILRTRSLSERCKFMPEPKTWKILTKHKIYLLFPWFQFHEKI